MSTYTFHLTVKDDEDATEDSFEVEFDYEPYTPGQLYGPPEDCYPADGGYADVCEGSVLWTTADGKESAPIPFSAFLEIYIKENCIESDPSDKKYPKTALRKAVEQINEILYTHCEESASDAEADDACDRYHYDKENDFE